MVAGVGGTSLPEGDLGRRDQFGLELLQEVALLGIGHGAVGVGVVLVLAVEEIAHLPHPVALAVDHREFLGPERGGLDGGDRALELRQCRRCPHRPAKLLRVGLRVEASYAHHPDHKRHVRDAQIAPDVADEVREVFSVIVEAAGFATVRVGMPVHHVVEALQPHEPRDLVALRGVVGRDDPPRVGEHPPHVLHHEPVIVARVPLLVGEPLLHVLGNSVAGRAVIELLLEIVELVRSRARRPEVGV